MTLRKKTLLISAAAICCLTIILLFATNTILLHGFTILEKQDMEKDLTRVQNVLAVEKNSLDTMVSDWAFWDDTYDFINDKNQEYIRKNINDVTFITQKLNFIMYLDLNGNMVYGQGFDLEDKTKSPIPEGLLAQIKERNILYNASFVTDGASGIVILPSGPALVAVRPIMDTNKQKPTVGNMIVGRYLSNREIIKLGDTAQLSLSAYLYNDQNLPDDFIVTKENSNIKNSVVITALDDENIAGYVVVPDIYNNSGMIFRVDDQRNIYMQGKSTLAYVTIVLIVAGLLFGVINLLFLEKTVLARLANLSRQVMVIGKQGNPAAVVDVSGDDELTDLSGAINKMLKSLSLAQNELRTSELITRVLLDGVPDSMLRLDNNGVILDFKTGRNRMTSVSPHLFAGRNISECYSRDVVQVFMEKILEAASSNSQQVFEYKMSADTYDEHIYQEVRIDSIGDNEVIAIIRDYKKANNSIL